jgi:hypothetical protein
MQALLCMDDKTVVFLSAVFVFGIFAIVLLLFCLPKKVTKKGPAISYAMIADGSLIKLLYYCSEQQQNVVHQNRTISILLNSAAS